MYSFVPNKSFGQLLEISPKTFHSEFSCTEVWFANQNSKPIEIEDEINLPLVINWCVIYKIRYLFEPRDRIFVNGYKFLSFAKNMGKNIGKTISKNLSSKFNEKRLDHARRSATDALKTASKKATQKTPEATGDLIDNKVTGAVAKLYTVAKIKLQ